MKKFVICGLLSISVLFTSCIGSFSAFNGLREWNENVTDSKFGNELIFVALWILPVYGIATLGDLVVFNAIEFWGGDNPIAMNEGDSETRTIVSKGNTYEITATKNQFDILIVEGKRKGESAKLIYSDKDSSWNTIKKGKKIKLSSLKKGLRIAHLPNGKMVEMNKNLSRLAQIDYLQTYVNEYEECKYAEVTFSVR